MKFQRKVIKSGSRKRSAGTPTTSLRKHANGWGSLSSVPVRSELAPLALAFHHARRHAWLRVGWWIPHRRIQFSMNFCYYEASMVDNGCQVL